MSNIVKDGGKKEERSKIACSDKKIEDEPHSTVATPSMEWEDEELDLTFAPGRHMVYCKPMEEQKLLPMGVCALLPAV